MRFFTLYLLLMLPGVAFADTASPIGIWSRDDGRATVSFERCGSNLCAVNKWIKAGTPSEKAGDILVMTLKPVSGKEFDGSAWDPQRQLTYKIRMTVQGSTMSTQGCVLGGLLCKSVGWTKAQ